MSAAGTIHDAFHKPETPAYRWVQGTIWLLIVASILMLVVEPFLPQTPQILGPFRLVDDILLGIFIIEYVLRVASFRPPALEVFQAGRLITMRTHILARLRFAMRPLMLVDLLAVLTVFPELRGLRALRFLRLLRTIPVFQYANPFASITRAFEENSLLFVFASLMTSVIEPGPMGTGAPSGSVR